MHRKQTVNPKRFLPVFTKPHLHTYFANTMSVFSAIIGVIHEKSQQPELADSLKLLHKKLLTIREDFLTKYHQIGHQANNGLHAGADKIKIAFEHMYQFEKHIVSELTKTGITLQLLPGQQLTILQE